MTSRALQKSRIRRSLRGVALLSSQNKIPKDILREFAAYALAWEISTTLTEKAKGKQRRFVKKLESKTETGS